MPESVRETVGWQPRRSLGELLRDLSDQVIGLAKQELELSRSEYSEKRRAVTSSAITLVVGGFVLYTGLLALVAALCIGVAELFQMIPLDASTAAWLGPLAVGVFFAAVGGAVLWWGKSSLQSQSLTPERTLQSLKEDTQWIQGKFH